MAWFNTQEINVRNEALKFFEEIHETSTLEPRSPGIETRNFAVTGGQDLESYLEEIHRLDVIVGHEVFSERSNAAVNFLKRLEDRFEADYSDTTTHRKLMDAMVAYATGELRKSQVYTRFCLLLIGHADLFHQFERYLYNGREESRREIENWRVQVRQNVVRELDLQLGLCRSTIATMKEAPENLNPVQRKLIEKECSFQLDQSAGSKWEKNPRLNYSIVLPCLEEKKRALLGTYDYVLAYFEQVLSNTLYPLR